MADIDVGRYLERIRYAGATAPTLATLRQLHVAHLTSVPFENLSVRRGEPIALEVAPLFEKIVLRRRGAWPLSAFEGGCRYHQTSPKSSFTQKTVISRATESGRITLSERRLIVTSHGKRSETDLGDEASVSRALAEHFGIR